VVVAATSGTGHPMLGQARTSDFPLSRGGSILIELQGLKSWEASGFGRETWSCLPFTFM